MLERDDNSFTLSTVCQQTGRRKNLQTRSSHVTELKEVAKGQRKKASLVYTSLFEKVSILLSPRNI